MAKRKDKSELKPVGTTDESGNDGSSKSLDLQAAPKTLGSAPKPSDAEKATQAKPDSPSTPKRAKPSVPLRVFLQISGKRDDHKQSFIRYVQLEELRPCPVAEWHERFEAFRKRPVKALKRVPR